MRKSGRFGVLNIRVKTQKRKFQQTTKGKGTALEKRRDKNLFLDWRIKVP